MKRHEHYWSYIHTIWGGRGQSVIVARYCKGCELIQCATASKWRPVPRSAPDITEEAKKAIHDDHL